MSQKEIFGISLSGGEPTEQIPALLPFLEKVRSGTGLSILLFSGRYLDQILSLPGGKRLITLLDVLIDGPYIHKLANPPGVWPASKNQHILMLTERYNAEAFSSLPVSEIIVTEKGDIIQSGMMVLEK